MTDRWLVADLGGTNARFAIADPDTMKITEEAILPTSSATTLVELVEQYLRKCPGPRPTAASFACAGPVVGDRCTLTNAQIEFSIEATQHQLGLSILLVVNDFAAVARAIPELQPEEIIQIGDGALDVEPAALAIGPGTGLGVATVLRSGTGWHVLAGEGGHVGLSGLYEDQGLEILRVLRDELGLPSAESVLSGPGLTRLFMTLADLRGERVAADESRPSLIVDRACAGTDEHCVATLNLFCQILGATAANAALTTGATGGVFLAGGVVRRFPDFLARSAFRERFVTHPDLGHYLERIGTAVVVAPEPGLVGAFHLLLDEHERGGPGPKPTSLRLNDWPAEPASVSGYPSALPN
jgi:glucokinase